MAELNPERKKLLDKLLALLALANDKGAFAAEAATARAKAEELMRKHKLSLGEGSKDRSIFEFQDHEPWKKGAQWEYIIAHALGTLCGCEVYWYGDFEGFTLVGTIGDLEALRYMLDAVRQQRIRAWLEHKKTGAPDKFWSFCFSYARGLERKIEQLIPAGAVAARSNAALWYESTRHIDRHTLIGGAGASAAGREAGASASLHRGVMGGPGSQPRLTGPRR